MRRTQLLMEIYMTYLWRLGADQAEILISETH